MAGVALLLRSLPVLALVLATGCGEEGPDPTSAGPVVARVVDGDTVVVRAGGREATVRLLGIDTPETVHPSRPVECFGPEAAARTAELLPAGTAVRLEHDREHHDAFGRLLLYVHRADGLFVNEALVAEGMATVAVISPNVARADELRRAEAGARSRGAGLWGTCPARAGP